MNQLFKALNDPTRRKILELLRERDMNAGEIAEAFHISKPSISHHLDLLKQADLVSCKRAGQFMTYALNTTVMDDLMNWLFQFNDDQKTKSLRSKR